MKFVNIPKIEDDEYIYSYVLRTALANGFDIRSIDEVIFKETWTKYRKNSYDFDMNIIKLSELFGMETALPFYLKTSLFNGVAPFMDRDDISKRVELLNNCYNPNNSKHSGVIRVIKRLKICPECMAEEIKKNNFFYYHRSHQMPNVDTCYKHHCDLMIVDCNYGKEFDYPLNLLPVEKNDIEDKVGYANFCHRLLSYDFYTTRMSIKKYLYKTMGNEYNNERNYSDLIKICFDLFGENFNYSNFDKLLRDYQYTYMLDAEILSRRQYILLNSDVNAQNSRFYDHRIIELVHKKCHTRFITTPYRMLLGYGCPFCDSKKDQTKLYIQALNRIINKNYDLYKEFVEPNTNLCTKDGIDKTEGKLRVLSINRDTLRVKHSTCGNIFEVEKRNLLEQPWCKICYPKEDTTTSFKNKLTKMFGDEYSLIGEYKSARDKIVLKHNICGKEIICYPRSITKDMKCRHCSHKKTYELFVDALKEIYSDDEIIFLDEINLPDFPKNRNKYNISKAAENGLLYKLYRGIYSFNSSKISNDELFNEKFLIRNGNRIGYYKGFSFAFEIGLITDKPKETSICTNIEASTHGRMKSYFDVLTRIHASPLEIDNDNWICVATLDFLTSSKYLGFEYDELDPLWQWLRANDILCSDFDDYYKYFGSWVEKKLKQYFKEA